MKSLLLIAMGIFTFNQAFAVDVGAAFFDAILEESIGNGHAYLGTYDVENFNIKDITTELVSEWEEDFEDHYEEEKCRYVVTEGVSKNLELLEKLIKDSDIYMEESLANLFIQSLWDLELTNAVSVIWDGKSGDSEYCSIYQFVMFTPEGQKLFIDAQNTD